VPGGGGSGPCRCATKVGASTAHAKIKSVLNPIIMRCFSAIPEMTLLILSALLTLIHSLLYLKIRCIEKSFRGSHLTYNG